MNISHKYLSLALFLCLATSPVLAEPTFVDDEVPAVEPRPVTTIDLSEDTDLPLPGEIPQIKAPDVAPAPVTVPVAEPAASSGEVAPAASPQAAPAAAAVPAAAIPAQVPVRAQTVKIASPTTSVVSETAASQAAAPRRSVLNAASQEACNQAFVIHSVLRTLRPGSHPAPDLKAKLEKLLGASSQNLDIYAVCNIAAVKAEAARVYAASDIAFADKLASSAETDLLPLTSWLGQYGNFTSVHGFEEPAWLHGRADATSQAIIALVALEAFKPDAKHRLLVEQLAAGLKKLLHSNRCAYPFGSHFSYLTSERPRTYDVPGNDEKVAGALLVVEHNAAPQAMAQAGRLLNDKKLIVSAESEAMGLMARLALSNTLPYDYAPRPEYEVISPLAAASVVENLAAVKKATGKPVYGILAGCAALNATRLGSNSQELAAKQLIDALLKEMDCGDWVGAKDICEPFAGILIELEEGKAVQKAFDTYDVVYPGGTPGKFAVVGRDNMFWMRFDVDREDEYFFHLCFLKSSVSGGLVSVMMRIDGDEIFRVNLGGATDDPYVDAELVAGPRHLRQGPHSFGIRFSGLLMKNPAVLDAIMVEPAVQRRWVALQDGRSLLVLNSTSEATTKVRMQELENKNAGQCQWELYDANGTLMQPKLSTDKRGRVWLDMPAGGAAALEWDGAIPGMDRDK